jgi:hypothetical protein
MSLTPTTAAAAASSQIDTNPATTLAATTASISARIASQSTITRRPS